MLQGLSLPPSVDLSSGSGTAQFTVTLSDAANLSRVEVLLSRPVPQPGGPAPVIVFDAPRTGTNTLALPLPSGIAPGEVAVTGLRLMQTDGTIRSLSPADLAALGADLTMTLTGTALADTRPFLDGFYIYDSLDLSRSLPAVLAEVGVASDRPALASAQIMLTRDVELFGKTTRFLPMEVDGHSARLTSAAIGAQLVPGYHEVQRLILTDVLGNRTVFGGDDLAALGYDHSVELYDSRATAVPQLVLTVQDSGSVMEFVLRSMTDFSRDRTINLDFGLRLGEAGLLDWDILASGSGDNWAEVRNGVMRYTLDAQLDGTLRANETITRFTVDPGTNDFDLLWDDLAIDGRDIDLLAPQYFDYGSGHVVLASVGDDRLMGTDRDDFLSGGPGADLVSGGYGDDILSGGAGADNLTGLEGDDTLNGGSADDTLSGDEGEDLLFGGHGNDQIFGETGADTLLGMDGDDWLSGGAGADEVYGNRGNDTLGIGTSDALRERDIADDVYRLYRATLDREPDFAGLQDWAARWGSGQNYTQIALGFVGSPEFLARYGALDDQGFVTLLYRNVLDRAPDGPGLAYWLDRLATGDANRTGVVQGFAQSIEFRNKTQAATMDYLRAQSGDTLNGGDGSDVIYGELASDTFVFTKGDSGRDTVYNLSTWDFLRFEGFGFTGANDVLDRSVATGFGFVFTYDATVIEFRGLYLDAVVPDMILV